MGVPERQIYTVEDYYNMSEDIRAEIIDGQIYYQDAPSRVHQEILGKLFTVISNHIKSKGGSCKVCPFLLWSGFKNSIRYHYWVIQFGHCTLFPSQYCVKIGCFTFGRER